MKISTAAERSNHDQIASSEGMTDEKSEKIPKKL
jgi:hypothetical protein